MLCLYSGVKLNAQLVQCSCGVWADKCAYTADQLWDYLDPQNLNNNYIGPGQAGSPKVIGICGTINLGELDAYIDKFPLEIPEYVHLVGNYNFIEGSRIVFPWRFKNSRRCGSQNISADEAERVKATDETDDPSLWPDLLMMGPSLEAFAFAMQRGSQFNNICLQGPKNDIKEEFMYLWFDNVCPPYNRFEPFEGLGGGILMRGDDCQLNNSEVYGFGTYNIHVRPENTSTISNVGIGTAQINNCLIHNSKMYGWGYGIFGSGGGGNSCTQNWQCVPNVRVDQTNDNQPDQNMMINNTIFYENAKDFDAAGNRYNCAFNNCTMGLRSGFRIINQHRGTKLCNWYPGNCINNSPVLQFAGGNSFTMFNNFFMKGGNEFRLNYPNTFGPGACTFTNPISPDLTLNGNFFLGYNTNHLGRVFISECDHYDWDFNHFQTNPSPGNTGPLNTLDVMGVPGSLTFLDRNNYRLFNDNTILGIPHVNIGAMLPPGTVTINPTTHYSIYVGDIIQFHTELNCINAQGVNSSDPAAQMWYMWRFHGLKDDLADEVRTGHLTEDSPLEYQFNQIGITNINLIGVDRATNTMSYIATHPVTVKPTDDALHLVFNIKDTYEGPWQRDEAGCFIDKREIILPPGSDLPAPINGTSSCPGNICEGDAIVSTITGFKKYVKINGMVIWSQDIGEDAGGWQRIEYPHPGDIPLEDCLCTDNGSAPELDSFYGTPNYCNTNNITRDNIEIGLRAESNVNGTLVRGIAIYLDDAYVNSGSTRFHEIKGMYNENVLANGDFEDINLSNGYPTGWNPPFYVQTNEVISQCIPTWEQYNTNSPKLLSEEVRSGIYSLWFRLRTPADYENRLIPNDVIYPMLIDAVGEILPYFSISQDFSFEQLPPPRKPKPAPIPAIDFTIKPNPSAFGTTLTGSIQNLPANQSYQVSIYTPEGMLAYLGNGYTSEFTISKTLPAGVYYVKVWGKGFSNYKRIVVVG